MAEAPTIEKEGGGEEQTPVDDSMNEGPAGPRPTICYGRILLGEITPLLATMKRSTPRWSSHQQDLDRDPLVMKLKELQTTVISLGPDDSMDPNTFLDPFLAIIRSEDTSGPVTKSALAAVNRILNYGLINGETGSAASAVEAVAAAVTHARFVGTDQGADEVVLWEILTVLRTLMLGPVGHLLTNESVCEILNSSFRICFETRLSELLRNCTEDALRHMVQLLFARLPQFKDDPRVQSHAKRLKMRAGGESKGRRKGKHSPQPTPSSTPPPAEVPAYLDAQEAEQEQPEATDITGVATDITGVATDITGVATDMTAMATEMAGMATEMAGVEESSSVVLPSPSESEPESLHSPIESLHSPITESPHSPIPESLHSPIVAEHPAGDTTSVDSGIMEINSPGAVDISHTHLAPDNCGSMENLESPRSETDGICTSKMSDSEQMEGVSRERTETNTSQSSAEVVSHGDVETVAAGAEKIIDALQMEKEDFINAQGVKFTQEGFNIESGSLVPYGMPCVREVLRFLISLTSPTNEQNTPGMILTALNLLTVGLEVGADHINNTPSLLNLLKDQLCRNLFMLLKPDFRLSIFMASLRMCTLLCESLRSHLKFQVEMFLNKLTEIITSEAPNISYAHKELALETIVQLWRIPGFITELFLNFDCDRYSSNLFEDLTKILSKNAFPLQGLYSTNLLSLEALFTVIETIEAHKPHKDKAEPEKNEVKPPLVVAPVSSGYLLGLGLLGGFSPVTPMLKARSVLYDSHTVSREHLLALKEKKKLLAAGTDQFNAKPDKGIKFLQENGIIGTTIEDIAGFLRENPKLCKQMIGEYVSRKKHVDILSAFVKSFEFRNLRVDEALRAFLESFRLPGEAPLIAIIIEHFSAHWHTSNNEPFGKEDAAFTLAYAVIMLNVDQHNQNAKKQNVPMTVDQFRNNLRGVNDNEDFDQDMLEEIYLAIKSDEIIMPAEQTGLVKENYMWKMLLKRGGTKDGQYVLANDNTSFDRDLFTLCWGPTIASLSYVFDKSDKTIDDAIIQRAVTGFRKCASISARFGMSDVFDNLVVSLCKFTTLTTSTAEAPEHVTVAFGANKKAQLAAKTVFKLVTSHGDILRDGWKNIIDLLLQLFRCRLLPASLVESEDFVESTGHISLVRETPVTTPRVETSFLSSFYSYIALGDAGAARGSNPEDVELSQRARTCIAECHPERLITESAFLRYDSLSELLKAMMGAGDASTLGETGLSPGGNMLEGGTTGGLDEHSQAFLLELVVQVLVANKDRAVGVWPGVRNHIHSLLMGAAAADRQFLLERCVVAMLRLAKVLLRRPNLANPILQSLRMLLVLRPNVLLRVSLQVVCGLREVLSVNTDNIQDPNDWTVLFNLLECAGAGAKPPPMVNSEHPDVASDTGSVSESDVGSSGVDSGHYTDADPSEVPPTASVPPEQTEVNKASQRSRAASPDPLHNTGGWILVGREGEIEPVAVKPIAVNEWDIVHQRELGEHRPEALVQAVDTVAFLVRDRHITRASLPSAVQACRTFVEATLNGGRIEKRTTSKDGIKSPSRRRGTTRRRDDKAGQRRPKSPSSGPNAYDADESDSDEVPVTYQQVSEKLLDLMDTLHTASSQIVEMREPTCRDGAVTVALWSQALCPLLQGIARYCCDSRTTIRNLAMTYLQRALLNHDLQALSALEWESCFNKVLFPLLAKLLQPLPGSSPASLEETRVRAATLVQKVYLRHLTPLLTLSTFTALWLTILDFMDKYLNTHRSDHLSDAIPEIMKNMLLVMETTQVFHTADGFTRLWTITWDRIDAFLPDFRHHLFRSHPPSEIHKIEVVPSEVPAKPAASEAVVHTPTAAVGSIPTEANGSVHIKSTEQNTISSVPSSPEAYVPPTLKEQGAASLSLSEEELPTSYGSSVILQPPLPGPTLLLPAPPDSPGHTAGTPIPQVLSTTPLASGSLASSPIPPTLPHLTPSFQPAMPLTDQSNTLFPVIFSPTNYLKNPDILSDCSYQSTLSQQVALDLNHVSTSTNSSVLSPNVEVDAQSPHNIPSNITIERSDSIQQCSVESESPSAPLSNVPQEMPSSHDNENVTSTLSSVRNEGCNILLDTTNTQIQRESSATIPVDNIPHLGQNDNVSSQPPTNVITQSPDLQTTLTPLVNRPESISNVVVQSESDSGPMIAPQSLSSSLFPISIPSILNPFILEVDKGLEPNAIPSLITSPPAVAPPSACTMPDPCTAKDASTPYLPTSILFGSSADDTPFPVDLAAATDPSPSPALGTEGSGGGPDTEGKQPHPLLVSAPLCQEPVTLFPSGSPTNQDVVK